MKEGWEYKTFEECIVKVPRQKQIKSKDYLSAGIYPVVSQEQDLISGYYNDESYVYKHAKPIVVFGDHTKNIKYIDFDFVIGADGTQILMTIEDIETKFFYYAIKSIKLDNLGYARHYKLLKKNIIGFPSKDQQRRIVSYLDSSFKLIDEIKNKALKSLTEAKALFQSALAEAMEPKEGWEEKILKNICKVINGRAYLKPEMLDEGKYRLLRVGNFFTNSKWYYTNLELEEEKYCNKGDLLYAWSASFGPKIWDGEKVVYHYHIWKIQCEKIIDKKFMYYWLDSNELKKQVMSNLHGSTMAHITKKIIEECNVSFPPLPTQKRIVSRLDKLSSKVRAIEDKYQKVVEECDALKQAMLRDVFE